MPRAVPPKAVSAAAMQVRAACASQSSAVSLAAAKLEPQQIGCGEDELGRSVLFWTLIWASGALLATELVPKGSMEGSRNPSVERRCGKIIDREGVAIVRLCAN